MPGVLLGCAAEPPGLLDVQVEVGHQDLPVAPHRLPDGHRLTSHVDPYRSAPDPAPPADTAAALAGPLPDGVEALAAPAPA
ncbi:hypothetical protein [Streptomyces sp. NPDC051014]|uniref:hypothetical protein n=1 Tax=Streptomyces sp. NPDC051014 TaxID=3155751 RepID=UPI0033DCF21D